jgi:hypothetical protein
MAARSLLAARLGALLVAALAGCDSWSASTTNILPVDPSTGGGGAMMASSSILDRMEGATMRVPFQGQRRIELHWQEGAVAKELVYTELVTADGAGSFAIHPLELIEPALPPAQASQFLHLQEMRQSLFFRYRDFEVRDLDLFAANYGARFTGDVGQVAGRDVERLVIQRRIAPDRRFTVDVDPLNGLVLRASEVLLDGTLVARLEFSQIELDPSAFTPVSFHQPLTGEISLPTNGSNLARSLGFQPHQPRQLPSGFDLIEMAELVDPQDNRTWAKQVFSDGVELLFFLEAKPDDVPGFHVQPGSTQDLASLRSLSIGPWTVLQADYNNRQMIVMGKQSELALEDAIRSAFP